MPLLKVAHILPSLKPTGLLQASLDLAKALEGKVEVDYFFFEPTPDAVSIEGAVELYFAQLHDFSAYDIVHSHGLRADAYVWYHSKSISAKKITTMHNYVEDDLTDQYNRVVSAIFQRVWKYMSGEHDLLVVQSEHMRDYYRQLWETDNIRVIPNLRLMPEAEPDAEIVDRIQAFRQEGFITIGSVAHPVEHKGLDQIIRVLPIESNLRFVLIGEGKETEVLKRLAEKLQVSDRCLFLGSLDRAFRYLPLFDCFIMPARRVGFPLTVAEAMRMKVPVVVSDIEVMKELFGKSEVYFFELENITSLSKAIMQASTDEKGKVEHAYAKATGDLSADVLAQKYLQLYQELIAL